MTIVRVMPYGSCVINPTSCVEKMTGVPQLSSRRATCAELISSKPRVGSSATRRAGDVALATAPASRCRRSPSSSSYGTCLTSSRSKRSSSAPTRAMRSLRDTPWRLRYSSSAASTLEARRKCDSTCARSTNPTAASTLRRPARCAGSQSVPSRSKVIDPPVGMAAAPNSLTRVLLPAPLSPMMATLPSPGAKVQLVGASPTVPSA